jgi:tRNA(fMet)-specific endonuclease VapC
VADNVPDAVAIFNKADHIAVPVIVLGEFRFGAAQSRKRKDYENWLVKLIAASFVLHIDEQTTTYYAAVRFELKQIGRPIPGNDFWIAALCRQHSLPLLSRDRHFDFVPGVKRITW